MRWSTCFAALMVAVSVSVSQMPAQDGPAKTAPTGVYAVLRESAKEQDVLPLKQGERLVVNRHRYLPKGDKEEPRFLVICTAPEVKLDLVGEPKAVKEGEEVVRILLTLQPRAAKALERLTADQVGKHVAIVVGGEVVTTHRIREVITGGEVQITNCAAGSANFLLEQLQGLRKAPCAAAPCGVADS